VGLPEDRHQANRRRVRSAYRRQLWIEILIPFGLGAAAVISLVATGWRGITAAPGGLADVSLAILLLPFLVVGLVVLIVVVGLIIGVTWGMGKVSHPAEVVQGEVQRLAGNARRAADLAVRPISKVEGLRAAAGALWKWFVSGSAADL
jgi:hypothetical protein